MQRRATLVVAGEGATAFLQNLVTCDVEGLRPGDLSFGALLTPQGKILFDFFVLRENDGFLLDTLASARDALVQRLTFYKLRAPVDVAADDRAVALGANGLVDPRDSNLPRRNYLSGDPSEPPDDYDAARIALGIAEAPLDFAYGDAFPHDVLMHEYERPGTGVDFAKGCFVGQEVVSRMRHRGTARRRPVWLRLSAPAATGASVTADGRDVGTLGTVAGEDALAIVRVDRVRGAEVVAVDGTPVAGWQEVRSAAAG